MKREDLPLGRMCTIIAFGIAKGCEGGHLHIIGNRRVKRAVPAMANVGPGILKKPVKAFVPLGLRRLWALMLGVVVGGQVFGLFDVKDGVTIQEGNIPHDRGR